MTSNHRRANGAMVMLALASGLVLGGCTSAPVARWERGSLAQAGSSFSSATDYLGKARTHYETTVAEQMAHERNLSNGLIGTGAVVLALATAKVHADAILGASLLAGTGYALGNRNLPRNRVMIYLEGIKALGCVEQAAAPLAPLGSIPTDELSRELGTLAVRQSQVDDALTSAQKLQPPVPTEEAARLSQLQRSADEAKAAGVKVTAAAHEQLGASAKAGHLMVAAVNEVDEAVTRAVVEDTPKLSTVPSAIGGLRDMTAAFAPGIDLKIMVPEAPSPAPAATSRREMARLQGLIQSQGGSDNALLRQLLAALADAQEDEDTSAKKAAQAAKKIEDSTNALIAQAKVVQTLTMRTAASIKNDAFSGCGVAAAVPKLTATPATLSFKIKTPSRSIIDIQGGTPPYFAEWDGPTSTALSIKPPIRYDTRVEVTATPVKPEATALQTRLRITDSAPTPRPVYVDVSLTD